MFWNAEWGNALEIGFELLTPHVRNIVWRDCDIIRVETGAVFSIHNGDSAAVEDVRFENIRVEDARDKLVDFRVGLSIYSQDCPDRYHRRNPKRKATGAGQWVPWEKMTDEEQAVARQNRGAIRNVRLSDIQLLEKVPPRSFIVNSGGELSGVSFQNLRQGDRVLTIRGSRPERRGRNGGALCPLTATVVGGTLATLLVWYATRLDHRE